MNNPSGIFEAFASGELQSLSASFPVDSEQAAGLKDWLQEFDLGWPDRGITLNAAHWFGRGLVTLRLWFSSCDLDDAEDYVLVAYEWEVDPVSIEVLTAEHQELIEASTYVNSLTAAMGSLVGSKTFRCTSFYRLSLSDWTPCIALPLMRINIPGSPFQQISGVRFTSPHPSKHHFAVLEMVDEDTLNVSLGFASEGDLSDRFFETLTFDSGRMRDYVVKHKD